MKYTVMFNPPGKHLYSTPLMRQMILLQPSLKPALRKVADFILRDPMHAATLKIEEMGQETHTSTAAVNRLSGALGLNGFTALHIALIENLRDWVSPANAVRTEVQRHPLHGFSLEQQVRFAKGSLDTIMDTNEPSVFEAMVRALGGARRIYILGFGHSYHLAGLFASGLQPLCQGVAVISIEGGLDMAAHRLAPITAEDVLVVISLPPYSRETVPLTRYAKGNGATILALTDSPASPLVSLARHTLFAPPLHPVLASSTGALLAVIEALVAAVSLGDQQKVNSALEQARKAQAFLDTQHLEPEKAVFETGDAVR
jgi:DNA-binding MurR/RpiR family transcriptional regulator